MSRPIDHFPDTLPGRLVVRAIARYFSAKFLGEEHVPRTGGALLVGNHGVFGFDAFVLGAMLARDVRRMPTWLADRHLWLTPGFGRALDFVGAAGVQRQQFALQGRIEGEMRVRQQVRTGARQVRQHRIDPVEAGTRHQADVERRRHIRPTKNPPVNPAPPPGWRR